MKKLLSLFLIVPLCTGCSGRSFREKNPLPISEMGFDSLCARYFEIFKQQDMRSGDPFSVGNPNPFKGMSYEEVYEWRKPYLYYDEEYSRKELSIFQNYRMLFNTNYTVFTCREDPEQLIFVDLANGFPYPNNYCDNYAAVTAVESNGIWSYIFNYQYTRLFEKYPDSSVLDEGIWILCYTYKMELVTYDVYFDKYHIYFMNPDEAFSREYIRGFNKDKDIHIFRWSNIGEFQ